MQHSHDFINALNAPDRSFGEVPFYWWTGDRLLQANLINTLNGLVWGMSDPKSRGPRPKLVGPSWADAKRERGLPAQTMSRDALMAELSRPRRKREEVAADE